MHVKNGNDELFEGTLTAWVSCRALTESLRRVERTCAAAIPCSAVHTARPINYSANSNGFECLLRPYIL